LYENGSFSPTLNGSVSIAAGSVFGGGTTVNWAACLKVIFTRKSTGSAA
jgi:hypothetical protein